MPILPSDAGARIAAALINALHRLVESRQESCEAKERLAGENPRR
jgi:hypothetical protein